MIGALVTGGLSLLGGLFGRSDKKKQQRQAEENQRAADAANRASVDYANKVNRDLATQLAATPLIQSTDSDAEHRTKTTSSNWSNSYVDVDGMMAAAEKAGFNPVTFLNAGGLAAYTRLRGGSDSDVFQTSSIREASLSMGHNAAYAAQLASPQIYSQNPMPVSNVPSVGSVVTNAVSAGYGQYLDDQRRAADQQFQQQQQAAYLQGVQANNQAVQRSMYVPSNVGYGSQTQYQNPVLAAPGAPQPAEVAAPTLTNPWYGLNIDPTTNDGAMLEERYGEFVGGALGLIPAFNDAMHWIQGNQLRAKTGGGGGW